jgi:hypothetical protein
MEEKDHLIEFLKKEVDVLKNAVSQLKLLLKSQAEVMKAKKKESDEERDVIKEE